VSTQIKYGFKIQDGKIFDCRLQSYTLEKKIIDKNVIYYMKPSSYRRLYLFEPLLYYFPVEKVFELLNFNKFIKKEREKEVMETKLHFMANMAVVYNYPPTYLMPRMFYLYKSCQKLKQKID